ncbi:cell wall-binding repeat-containing protein [Ornithinibacillus halophilus]|uniref:Bacillopeptidase F n=1 Tax=Ornithinibacillus halophilus TaxID=930117 RepID=A0A1M5EB65_9BACI|nr:cell wall-binding repeat-containing protein [Ornithinibacillus halophilus]SHF76437.1 bacillopeptidase F [Ornithinibacillus halophilus]
MRKKKQQVRAFSFLMTILMVFSLVTPGFVGAQGTGKAHISMNDSKSSVQAKVADNLLDQFKSEDKVTFLIKFKDKADVKAAAQKARENAASLSAYKQEHAQRSAVISELKATALQSQGNVVEYLESEVAKGNAEDVNPYYIVNGIAVTATKEVAKKLATFSEVEEVLENHLYQLQRDIDRETLNRATSDNNNVTLEEKEEINKQNNLQNTEWNVERVNAPDAWSMGITGEGTVVANIDTGVQWDHPALMEKYAGYDPATGEVDHSNSFFDPVNGQTVPYDTDGHGTHTMGTMVGSEPDDSNQVGVAPGAKWIAVQAFTPDGAYQDDLLAGAQWILEQGPDVVNNSWGGGPGQNDWFREAVIAWREAGIVPVFAAGNVTLTNPGGPGSVAVPANYPESFAVGNTMNTDLISSSSLRGPSPYGEIKPDVAAPGTGIRSSVPGSSYGGASGTSMAAPAVAGLVALLKGANAGLGVDEIEQIIMDTAEGTTDAQHPESPNNAYGHGIVDAFAAVTQVADGLGTIEGVVTMDGEDTEAPEYSHEPPSGFFPGGALSLSILANDDVSITSVEVSYDGKTLEADQVSGNHRSGEYAVVIPGEDTADKDSISYQFIINDFGGNEVVTEEFTVEASDYIYYHDFETEPTDWSTFQGNTGAVSWEWGEPTSGPEGAVSGDNVYATNLAGDYNTNEFSWLDMPAVQLPGGESYITFDAWYDIENIYDNAYIGVTTDPLGEYTVLDNFTGSSNGWETLSYDLSEFSGQEVYVAFIMESDVSVVNPGMYIDNVIVSQQPAVATSNGAMTQAITPMDVPLDATVSVLETGRSINTNPADGSYSMLHEAGTFTVVAESYGFASQEQTVELGEDGTAQADFVLEELPQATVSGTVTNERTGDPVEGATLLLVEDANVEPVATDAEGNYDLTAYEGTYTLKVVAQDYHPTEVEVELDGDKTVDIELEPFYTVPGGEIGYDDGTPENARAFYDPGNGWAVKMSLPEGQEQAVVTDGVFQFHGTDWPTPGGTSFAVEVWSAGEDGMPGEKLAGPVDAEAVRSLDEWTVVDLREHNIQVNGDFFMVYVQTEVNTAAPGLATDENGENAGRSYQVVGGAWSPSPAEEGNYMIRARVDYAVGEPAITSPVDGTITNEANVTVEGSASPTTTLNLLNNGEVVDSVDIDESGNFAIDVELSEGENVLKAESYVDGEMATESETVTVTLDSESPDLTITNPIDGELLNNETVTVEGTVSDAHLDYVEVNGEQAPVSDGMFSKRIMLDEGENVIDVVAYDLAGNMSQQSATVNVDFSAPVIENLEPSEDQRLYPGETLKIEFDSEPGLDASFSVLMAQGELGLDENAIELPMEEVSDGHYVGYYTVTDNISAAKANVRVSVTDEFGNQVYQHAEGKLFFNDLGVERIKGETRYETAIEISQEGWDSSDTVVLARGDNFADALAGVPLAHQLNAPILLTKTNELLDSTIEEIERLGATNVIVLGGTQAVSRTVSKHLEDLDLNVDRLSGDTRYDTAAAIAMAIAPDGVDKVVVANGQNYPDALSVASYAAQQGLPILLTKSDSIPEATQFAFGELGAMESVVVGGTAVVSDDVMDALPNAERLSGPDRYATSTAVAEGFGVDQKHMYIATGKEYADALSGAVLAAKNDSGVLLVGSDLPEVVSNYISDHEFKKLYIFGGANAVSDAIADSLFELLQ